MESRSRSCDLLENQRRMLFRQPLSYKERKAAFAADVRESKPHIGLIQRLNNHNGVFFPMQSDHAYDELEAPLSGIGDADLPRYTDEIRSRFDNHNIWLVGNIDYQLYFANINNAPARPMKKRSLMDRIDLNR